MKTKRLLPIAIGIFSLLCIIIFVGIPMTFVYDPWAGAFVLMVIMLIAYMVYVKNRPDAYMQKFHTRIDHPNPRAERYSYYKSKYSFSCGHAAMQMILEKYDIAIDQDNILALSGDKTLGITSWEVEETLNNIFFFKYGGSLKARTKYFATSGELFHAIQKGQGVIVMYINTFNEQGFSSEAAYPHFALLNYISENKVVLTSPTFAPNGHARFNPGQFEGEIVLSLDEFKERFYAHPRFLNRLEYKPILNDNSYRNVLNYCTNILFIFIFYMAYCCRILKPGLAIIVEPK
ncbi:MAG: hypothetical protein NTY80_02120 [candidate division SR1 bacterium]|nr:hypothetical protein [candidate division SR1 bacterium]